MSDAQKAIQAILKIFAAQHSDAAAPADRRVVCISRDYGSGGDEFARLLANRLGVDVYDKLILQKINQRLEADPETVKAFETGASRVRDLWLYSLITGQDVQIDHYRQHLVNVILSLGRIGGVILGSGAHLVLANSGALRVRFTGSIDACALRVAAAEHLDIEAARHRVMEQNSQRGKFIWDTFQQRLNDPNTFDLIINTDHVTDKNKVVDVLVEAMNMVGPMPNH